MPGSVYTNRHTHILREEEKSTTYYELLQEESHCLLFGRSSFIHCSCSVVWKRDPLHSVSLQVGASLVRSFVFAYLFSKVLHTVILFSLCLSFLCLLSFAVIVLRYNVGT